MKHNQYDHLSVSIAPDRVTLGRVAAADAAAELRAVLERQGAARVILASAPSQVETLQGVLAAGLDWSRITIFHMDEYVGLNAQAPASFRYFQKQNVLSRVQPAAFHGLRGEAPDANAECQRYAALLAEAPIDVVCLGIGENGHLAFNDPPVADFHDPVLVKLVELDDACRHQQVNDGCFPNFAAVPQHALTLTIPALLAGRALFCAVPGPRKAQAVREALLGPIATACPASILRTHPKTKLYLDSDSAALLP